MSLVYSLNKVTWLTPVTHVICRSLWETPRPPATRCAAREGCHPPKPSCGLQPDQRAFFPLDTRAKRPARHNLFDLQWHLPMEQSKALGGFSLHAFPPSRDTLGIVLHAPRPQRPGRMFRTLPEPLLLATARAGSRDVPSLDALSQNNRLTNRHKDHIRHQGRQPDDAQRSG